MRKKSQKILTPTGFEPASTRPSQPGSKFYIKIKIKLKKYLKALSDMEHGKKYFLNY